MVFDCSLAANALTGGSFESHLRCRENRLLWAQMIRECLQAFDAASKAGGWSPDCGASCGMSLRTLEQLLCLPSFLFNPCSWALLRVSPRVGSPMQIDLHDRRTTSGEFTLRELTAVGSKYHIPMPACTRLLELLRNAIQEKNGVPCIQPKEILEGIDSSFQSTGHLLNTCFLVVATIFGLWFLWILVDVVLPRKGL